MISRFQAFAFKFNSCRYSMDTKLGADATLSNAKAVEDTLKWTMGSKHTPHAEYTPAQVATYTDAYASSGANSASPGNGWVVGGGSWSYATFPRVRWGCDKSNPVYP
jgi:hypothetical protein